MDTICSAVARYFRLAYDDPGIRATALEVAPQNAHEVRVQLALLAAQTAVSPEGRAFTEDQKPWVAPAPLLGIIGDGTNGD